MLWRLLKRTVTDDEPGDDEAQVEPSSVDSDGAEGNGTGRPATRDLYRTDLDRHFWTLPRRKKARTKKIARWAASLAGMIGAAGLSYWIYRKKKEGDELEDPRRAQAED